MKIHFREKTLEVGRVPIIMGILNVTPDSFSDGGSTVPLADRIQKLLDDGVGIIDAGGESTRPGSPEVPVAEELARVIPAVKAIRALSSSIAVSVDTRKSKVARAALEAGADIINDVSGLNFDPLLASVIAEYRAGAVLMHMRALPENMQNPENTVYEDGLIQTVSAGLMDSVSKALRAGIPRENIILDPGIGFAKTAEQSAALIASGEKLRSLGYPLLSGPSRKSFIGKITGEKIPSERDYGTCGSVAASMLNGYAIVRVHNGKAASDCLNVFAACVRGEC